MPRDVSLVGFDDDPIAEWMTPALTTVRQDFSALGEVAARKLTGLVDKKVLEGETSVVPVSLVVRDSVVGRKR